MKSGKSIYKYTIILFFALIIIPGKSFSQLGFFSQYWQAKIAEIPQYIEKAKPGKLPETVITVNINDTIRKISPYVGGYNLNTYYAGKIYDKPFLLENIRNLDLPFFRYPGGSGSNWYFWDHAKSNRPVDVDDYIVKGEIKTTIKWGDEPGEDYLSLDNSYILRDSVQNEGIHVVNYSYARYGRSENPVQQAAHYAADWVRYDNGRTKFWEIGNENYGSWEPGYIIDASKNLDGQPVLLTGELYAQHSLVFLDSMRAAAAEIGSDIKIGAVLGFQEKRSDFDIPVIQTLGNKVDFYSVHEYFGNGQDADPYEVLESINEFYEQKTHIDNLINQYCDTYVPLIMTEWNTRYDGSNQNVSITNGMHNLLGFKGIINEGIGLSCKWNLIWGYQDGETHGLITGEKDNPSVEGIPAYSPRAPYFYIYHFKKFLGDISVNNSISTDSVDVFSSVFNSGHTGIVLVNKAKTSKIIAINQDDYNLGERYYWYSLTSADGSMFSRKVKVNGQTNLEYDAGGPLNYKDIEAWSATTEGGIKLELPPFSATFVLTEGAVASATEEFNATFYVYEDIDGIVTALKDAVVSVDQSFYMTDENGQVVISLPSGNHNYQVRKNGYDGMAGAFDLTSDIIIDDTLFVTSYSVAFNLYNEITRNPIVGTKVEIDGQEQITNSEGRVNFEGLIFNSYDLIISSNEYNEHFVVDIYSDSSFSYYLNESVYELKFIVLDSINHDPIGNAKVTFNSEVKYTSFLGEALFFTNYNSYNYSIENDNYLTQSKLVTINKDTTIVIELSPSSATIKFKILDESTPINLASIDLNGEIFQTNALGICYFYDLPVNHLYNYTITKADYETIAGSLNLRSDTSINLQFGLAQYDIEIQVVDKRKAFNISNASVSLNGVVKTTENDGSTNFLLYPGNYNYSIEKDRYTTFSGNHTAEKDTLFVIPLDLHEAIIEFKIYNNSTPINNAQVAMNSANILSNALGMATFNNVLVDSEYDYNISKPDYKAINSSAFVDYDSTIIVEMELATGLKPYDQQIFLYPNPAHSQLNINTGFSMKKVLISDVLGNVLIQIIPDAENSINLDISDLVDGVYFVSIQNKENNFLIRKIMKY